MAEYKHAKYIVTEAKHDMKLPKYRVAALEAQQRPPEESSRVMWLDDEVVPGAFYTECVWFMPGIGSEKPKVEAHVHPFDEVVSFFGTNHDDRVDGLAVVASDKNLVPYINRAQKAGVPVVTWNTEPSNLGNLIFTVKDQAEKLKELSQKLAVSTSQTTQATSRVKFAMSDVAQGAMLQNEEINETQNILESLLNNISHVNQETGDSAQAAEGTVKAVSNSCLAYRQAVRRIL